MKERSHTQDGQSIVLVALLMGVLLVFVAIAVDMSNAYAHRRQAQNAADAAVLAAAQELGLYLNEESTSDGDIAAEMNDYAQKNAILDTDGIPHNAVNANVIGCYLGADANCLDDMPPLDSSFRVGELGYVPDDAIGIEVVTVITAPTFFGGLVGLDGLRLQAEAASMFESACTAGGCVLPLAVHERGFGEEGEPEFIEGQCYNLWDGVSSSNLGWLNWSFQGYSCQALEGGASDCSTDCLALNMNPLHCARIDPSDYDVGNDIWIAGVPGDKNSDAVRDWLKYYINNEEVVRLVVFDDSVVDSQCGKMKPGGPSGTRYHLAGFAAFKVTGFRLSKGKGKAVYCDQLSDGTLLCGDELISGLDYTCDPATSLDYPPCYDDDGVTMVPCATKDSTTNRVTGIAQAFNDGDSGNCEAVGNLLAPRITK